MINPWTDLRSAQTVYLNLHKKLNVKMDIKPISYPFLTLKASGPILYY